MPHYKRNKDGSRKTGRKSSTPGVKKCKSCQTTPEIRIICSRNRSYKQKNYWLVQYIAQLGYGMSQ